MKKFVVAWLLVMLLVGSCYGAMVATRVSGNAVSFSTVTGGWATTPNVVTFNSTTNRIRLQNLSTVADCYVDLRCVDNVGKHGHMTRETATVMVPAMGRTTPNTVEIDFATRNIGFCADTNQISTSSAVKDSNQQIRYTLIGEVGDF